MSESAAQRRLHRPSGRSALIRGIIVALIDALIIFSLPALIANESWTLLGLLVISAVAINWAYLSPRTQAARWLTPGLVLMLIFVVYPVIYTAYISLTNWQTGNYITKNQAIELLERRTTTSDEASAALAMLVYADPGADRLALLVSGDETDPYLGLLADPAAEEQVAEPAAPLDGLTIDPAAPPATIGSFELLSSLQAVRYQDRLDGATMVLPDGRSVRVETLSTARVVTGGQRFTYDEATDTLYDAETDRTCRSGEGGFYCDGVPRSEVSSLVVDSASSTVSCSGEVCDNVPLYGLDQSLPGWRQLIGFDNYVNIFTNDRIRGPFLRVLAWNLVFASVSVLTTFALGLGLALAMKDESMKGRSIYRSIYILPYAIPGFLSILVWRGLLNTDFGKVNGLLNTFGLPSVNWLGTTAGAMAAVLFVNLWLGFPYMFLINSGALTSIPEDLLEAARVDGAGPWRSFRTITLPLLLVSTAPLLIGSFAFNFNNFILIFLLTNGGPPLSGYDVPVGSTDLLISFTFRLAQAAGRGSQFALSSAIVVLIFLVLATTSALSFRLTKRLEEIYDQ